MKNSDSGMDKDTLFAHTKAEVTPFTFDQSVVDVFPDMINRSVPGYNTIVETIPSIISTHIQEKSVIYDVGCSLGASSLSIARAFPNAQLTINALDYSEAMVERCKKHINAYNFTANISVTFADITEAQLVPCDAIVMNFTLQFIAPELRQKVINKLYKALNPNGVLIMSEKLSFDDSITDQKQTHLHHDFKKRNGYSELEIAQKRSALENVMITDTADKHFHRLSQAGFSHSAIWFQHFNFASFFALKT